MSRYYNEEWQRKKAYLIRSLFHDIPYRVLSPVLEESNQSSQAQIPADSSRSSDTNHTEESYPRSHEYQLTSESVSITSSESCGSDPKIADTGKRTPDPRPYSPLPPLIIEVEPNKHDEQEEFYRKLLLKMRKIYRRMFFEGKYISDEEFFESDIERDCMDKSLNEEPSFNVNLESTREDNILQEITNVDERRCSVEDKSDGNSSVESSCDEDSDNDQEEMEQESCASNGEPAYSQMTFKADIHIDGTPLPHVRPSPIYEDPRIEVLSASVKKFSCVVPQNLHADSLSRDTTLSTKISTSETTLTLLYEDSTNGTQSLQSEGQPLEQNGIPVHKTSNEKFMPSQKDKSKLESMTESLVSGQQLEVARDLDNEEFVTSPILTSTRKYTRLRKCSKTVFQDNQEHTCTQSTSEVEVGTEDSHGDVANRKKEDAGFVLRFRRTIEERSPSVERNLTILEDNEGSGTTPSSEENDAIMEEIEVMRTTRIDDSRESIPTGANRFSSHVDDNCDQNMLAANVSDMTPVIEDDEHINAVQQKRSGDIDDVLALLFNTTPELRQSVIAIDALSSQMSSSRKRRFEERSVQTMDVSWSDLRDNFFVGTPKILKLCSCMGHNCL